MKMYFYNILSLRHKINTFLTLKKKEAMHIKKLSHNKLAKGMTAPSLRAPTPSSLSPRPRIFELHTSWEQSKVATDTQINLMS